MRGRARAVAAVTALVVAGLAVPPGRAPGQTPAAPGFIDGHVHLNDPEAWLDLMNAHGISHAIVLRGRDVDNAGLVDAARRWPDRLFPFASVSPEHRELRALWVDDDPRLGQLADSLLSLGGFHGIGEISVTHYPRPGFPEASFDPAGRAMRAVLEAARKHSVPVMVHVELTRLPELASLLEAFEDVTVIWAHGGYSGVDTAERMLTRHRNLVYELSARTWAVHPRSPEYTIVGEENAVSPAWIDLIERMPERFLVGTDAALRSRERDRVKITSVQNLLSQLPPDVRQLVARGNLMRILGGRR